MQAIFRSACFALAAVAVAMSFAGSGELATFQQQVEPEGAVLTSSDLDRLMVEVDVVATRPTVPGYDRECGAAAACVFGQAWSDAHAGYGGHNGCDTRNDVLSDQLDDAEFKADTNDCVVTSGLLKEPYTGQSVEFSREDAQAVQIDHVYPLSTAWHMGAHAWDEQKRVDFANDQDLNLLAVDGPANASKGDRGPGEWMPINRAYACEYVTRYLQVAVSYGLAITEDDHAAAAAARPTCSSEE